MALPDSILDLPTLEVGESGWCPSYFAAPVAPDTVATIAEESRPSSEFSPAQSAASSPRMARASERSRAERLLQCEIEFVPDLTFGDLIPEPPARASERVPSCEDPVSDAPLLSAEREIFLFRRMNALKYRAVRLRARIDLDRIDPYLLDEIERLLEEARAIRNEIVRANLRLVVMYARRQGGTPDDFSDLVSEGNLAVIRAVEKFDPARGFKFSSYASGAILRALHRATFLAKRRRHRFVGGQDQALEAATDFRVDERQQDLAREQVGLFAARMIDRLTDRERRVLTIRFGLEGAQVLTLVELGQALGVTRERVRQIETRAIEKLRRYARDESIDSPLS